jgi:SAM-dependent methyltransferase
MQSRSWSRILFLAGIGLVVILVVAYAFRRPEPPPPAPTEFDPARFVADGRPQLDAPYVATSYQVVDAMLAMAEVGPDDYVVDLGSGDGRILIAAARSHGARGLGVDIDPKRIRESTANARAAGVAHRVTFRREDLFETEIEEADVLTLYLLPEINLQLRPRILAEMRPGTRVVSNSYDMGEWRADLRQRIGDTNIYMWIVPARAAGRWRLTDGNREALLDLRQAYQRLEGTVAVGGRTGRIEQGQVNGRRIRFVADLGGGRRAYEGRIDGEAIVPHRSSAGWRAVRDSSSAS